MVKGTSGNLTNATHQRLVTPTDFVLASIEQVKGSSRTLCNPKGAKSINSEWWCAVAQQGTDHTSVILMLQRAIEAHIRCVTAVLEQDSDETQAKSESCKCRFARRAKTPYVYVCKPVWCLRSSKVSFQPKDYTSIRETAK